MNVMDKKEHDRAMKPALGGHLTSFTKHSSFFSSFITLIFFRGLLI